MFNSLSTSLKPLALVAALAVAGVSEAGERPLPPNHIEGVRIDLHADLGGYGSFGMGFRLDIPVVPGGLINGVEDELAISPGLDVFFQNFYPHYYDGGPYFIPGVVMQWNFYLGQHWSVFPEAGIAFYAGNRYELRRNTAFYPVANFGVGARYHINPRVALLLRVSTPTGLQFGVTF